MVALKRKGAREAEKIPGSPSKRLKEDRHDVSALKKSRFTEEAETDSDPIVESDTGSESGEDDGASWPSDDEQETREDVGGGIDNGTGALQIAADASNTADSTQKDTNKSGKVR